MESLTTNPHRRKASKSKSKSDADQMDTQSGGESDSTAHQDVAGPSEPMDTSSDNHTELSKYDNLFEYGGFHNKATIDVEFSERSSGDQLTGEKDTLNTILAFNNSGIGGIIKLVNINEGVNTEDFYRKIKSDLGRMKAGDMYEIVGSYMDLHNYILVKTSSRFIFTHPHIYRKTHEEVLEYHVKEDIAEVINTNLRKVRLSKLEWKSYQYDEELNVPESDTREFKEIKGKKTIVQVKKFTSYISAFASHRGGQIWFGVSDKPRLVKGVEVKDEHKTTSLIDTEIKKMLWFECNKENKLEPITPTRGIYWNVRYIDVHDKQQQLIPNLKVVVIDVHRVQNIVVFAEEPECYLPSTNTIDASYKPRRLEQKEWLSYLQEHVENGQHLAFHLYKPRQPDPGFTDHGDKLCANYLKIGSFPTDMFDHDDSSEQIRAKLPTNTKMDEREEKWVAITTQFGRLICPNISPSEIAYRDILFLSDHQGVHLITLYDPKPNTTVKEETVDMVDEYSKQIASKLDKLLKCYLPTGNHVQFALMRHVHCTSNIDNFDLRARKIPQQCVLNETKFDDLRYSTVLMLSTCKPFHDHIGAKYLKVLTEKQFELKWSTRGTSSRYFIHGLAGSGKTRMALLLAQQLRGGKDIHKENVVYICHKSERVEALSDMNINKECRVSTMADFLRTLDTETNAQHIVVDDGHCYVSEEYDGWFKKLKKVIDKNYAKLDGTTGILCVFCDMSQNTLDKTTGLPSYLKQRKYSIWSLQKVVQNSHKVHENAVGLKEDTQKSTKWEDKWEEYYNKFVIEQTVDHSYEGDASNYNVTSSSDLSGKVKDILEHCKEKNIQPNQVRIVLSSTYKYDQLRGEIFGNWEEADEWQDCLCPIDQFDGLEYVTIILIHPGHDSEDGKRCVESLNAKTGANCHDHDITYTPDQDSDVLGGGKEKQEIPTKESKKKKEHMPHNLRSHAKGSQTACSTYLEDQIKESKGGPNQNINTDSQVYTNGLAGSCKAQYHDKRQRPMEHSPHKIQGTSEHVKQSGPEYKKRKLNAKQPEPVYKKCKLNVKQPDKRERIRWSKRTKGYKSKERYNLRSYGSDMSAALKILKQLSHLSS